MTEYIPESEGAWILVEENSPFCPISPAENPTHPNTALQLIGVAALGMIGGFVIFGGNK